MTSSLGDVVAGFGVDEGHGAFGEVAAFGDLPFVVDLDQDAAGAAVSEVSN